MHSDVGYIIPVVTIPVKLEYQWREGRFENMMNKLPVRDCACPLQFMTEATSMVVTAMLLPPCSWKFLAHNHA